MKLQVIGKNNVEVSETIQRHTSRRRSANWAVTCLPSTKARWRFLGKAPSCLSSDSLSRLRLTAEVS
jgi:hypothetical protein